MTTGIQSAILGVIIIEGWLEYKVLFLVLLLLNSDWNTKCYSWCYCYWGVTGIQSAILGVIAIAPGTTVVAAQRIAVRCAAGSFHPPRRPTARHDVQHRAQPRGRASGVTCTAMLGGPWTMAGRCSAIPGVFTTEEWLNDAVFFLMVVRALFLVIVLLKDDWIISHYS